MVSLMSFIHKVNYDRDTLYTEAERAAVTPNNIRQWMNKRAFGVRNPGPQARSTECRSTTLEVMKKAVSWYMPNRAAWDCVRGSGNPTRSRDVNEVIKAVKKLQVRRVGKATQTKRAMTQEEFIELLTFFSSKTDFQYRYRYSTMMKYQYHLIARCDDLANFRIRDLRAHSDPVLAHLPFKLAFTGRRTSRMSVTVPIKSFLVATIPLTVYCWRCLFIVKHG
jgi:hypothetical protein